MRLRYFKEKGIETFRSFLAECKKNPSLTPPWKILEDPKLTELSDKDIDIEKRTFKTKQELGQYLHTTLSPLDIDVLEKSSGLWTWLTLFYFDSVAPQDAQGKREILEEKRYIFDFSLYRFRGNHLLQTAWRIIEIAPRSNRIMSHTPPHVINGACWFIMSSTFITSIKCIFEVIDRLYWDEKHNCPKQGLIKSKKRPGTLKERFVPRIHQLEKNYDLTEIDVDTLIMLLGKEFNFARKSG